MKHILITGGAGYIGSHIGYLLAQKGYHVISIDNHAHQQPVIGNWATAITGDLSDKKLLETIFNQYSIDTVIHCAASIDIADSIKNPLNFYHNNVSNTIILLSVMQCFGVKKLIFSSSCAVYGAPHIIPMPEDHAKHPISAYGRSKLMDEQIIEDATAAYDMRAIIFRYFNAAGAMPEYGLQEWHTPEIHLIPRLLHAAYGQQRFLLFGNQYPTADGTCVRDFIHVWDIAHAHIIAVEKLADGHPTDYFNIGTGKGYSIKQIIQAIETILQRTITVDYAPARPGDPATLIADPTRAFNMLGWKPQFSDLTFIVRSANVAFQAVLDTQAQLVTLSSQP